LRLDPKEVAREGNMLPPDGRGMDQQIVGYDLPSRPGEFHPEPLTESDLSLSTYPARATP